MIRCAKLEKRTLIAEFIKHINKVYTFSCIRGHIIPTTLKCTHSATAFRSLGFPRAGFRV